MNNDELEQYNREAPSENDRIQRWPEHRSSLPKRLAGDAIAIVTPMLIVLVGCALGFLAVNGC